jgi:hypothetical protein
MAFNAVNPILLAVVPGRITLRVEARVTPIGNATVSLFNFQTQQFVNLGTMAFNGVDRTVSVATTTNVRRFINEAGGLSMRLSSIATRTPHRLEVDRVQIIVN